MNKQSADCFDSEHQTKAIQLSDKLQQEKYYQEAQKDTETDNKTDDWKVKKIPFNCYICGLSEKCHFLGQKPPFAKHYIEFKEECFVMIDPFSPKELRCATNFLVLGGNPLFIHYR